MEDEAIATNCTPNVCVETKDPGNEELDQLNFQELDVENIIQKDQAEFLIKSLEFIKFKLSIEYNQSILNGGGTQQLLISSVNAYLDDYIAKNSLQVYLEYLFYKSKHVRSASLLTVQPILRVFFIYWLMNTQNYLLLELYIQKFAVLCAETQRRRETEQLTAEELAEAQETLARYLKNVHILQNTLLFTIDAVLDHVLQAPEHKQIIITQLIIQRLLHVCEESAVEPPVTLHALSLLGTLEPEKRRMQSIQTEAYKQLLSQRQLRGFTDMQNSALMGRRKEPKGLAETCAEKTLKEALRQTLSATYAGDNPTLDVQELITRRGRARRLKLYESLAKTLQTPMETFKRTAASSVKTSQKSSKKGKNCGVPTAAYELVHRERVARRPEEKSLVAAEVPQKRVRHKKIVLQ